MGKLEKVDFGLIIRFDSKHHNIFHRVWNCMVERGQRHLRNPDQACQFLELGLNCTQEINDKCVQDAIFVDRILLPSSIIRGYKTKEYFDNPCFDQRFDEFFNQDGMCSFQDIKEYVLLNFFFLPNLHIFFF